MDIEIKSDKLRSNRDLLSTIKGNVKTKEAETFRKKYWRNSKDMTTQEIIDVTLSELGVTVILS